MFTSQGGMEIEFMFKALDTHTKYIKNSTWLSR